jgi:hypothetical protein
MSAGKKVYIVTEIDNLRLLPEMLEIVARPDEVVVLQYSGIRYNQMQVLQDLTRDETKIEQIVCLGSSALDILVPARAKDKITKLRDSDEMEWHDIPVHMTYSLQYLERKGGRASPDWQTVASDLVRYCRKTETAEKFQWRIYESHEWRQFLVDFKDADELALDYEGSSLTPSVAGFEVGGIGLAKAGYAGYLCFKDYGDLEYKLSPDVAASIGRYLRHKNNNGTLLVFNLKYEVPLTHSQFGQRLDRVLDVMAECRALDYKGGLKEICKRKLGVFGWTKDLDTWRECATTVLTMLRPTAIRPQAEWTPFLEGGVLAVLDFLQAKAQKIKKTKDKEGNITEAETGYNTRTAKVRDSIMQMLEISEQYYGVASAAKLDAFIAYKFAKQDYECNYTEVPLQLIGKYGAADCHNTLDLHHIVRKELEEANLLPAADYYNRHMYLGANMEFNGILWDDTVAERVESEHRAVMVDALRGFLMSDHVRATLPIHTGDKDGTTRSMHGQDMIDIQSCNDVDTLKEYFNPDSTAPANTVLLGTLLINPIMRIVMMLQDLAQQYQSNAKDAKIRYPALVRLLSTILSTPAGERGRHTVTEFAANIGRLIKAGKMEVTEMDLYHQYAHYKLPDATGESIQGLMDALTTFTGCNLDDRSTWVSEAYPVFYYKLYKKVSKAVSSFINGAGGRKSVRIARYNPTACYYERVGFHGDELEFQDEQIDMAYVAKLIANASLQEVVLIPE